MHEVKFDWDEVLPYRSLLAPQTHRTDGFHGNHDSKLKDQGPRTKDLSGPIVTPELERSGGL